VKIAIVGNMNNNGFALMRYLRDLGLDAHLFLYANDGKESLSHFRPENDTWQIDRWIPFIHQTSLLNSPLAGLNAPFSWIARCLLRLRNLRLEAEALKQHCLQLADETLFEGFDLFIGSGIAPAIFENAGRRLDVFFPYSTGIEHFGDHAFLRRIEAMAKVRQSFFRLAQRRQRKGLLSARFFLTSETSLTLDVCRDIGRAVEPLAIPMVYNREQTTGTAFPEHLKGYATTVEKTQLVFMTHSRQSWKNPGGYSDAQWRRVSKHSDWTIRAFARLVKARPTLETLLVALEYGADVDASKQLGAELGIADRILWLPKMSRRELSVFLSKADVVLGEFKDVDEMLWGGTGWEALAAGKPLIHSFRFAEGRYEEIFGHACPPVLAANAPDAVFGAMLDLADSPEKRQALARSSENWFNRHNGIGLARQWADLLTGETSPGKTETHRVVEGA